MGLLEVAKFTVVYVANNAHRFAQHLHFSLWLLPRIHHDIWIRYRQDTFFSIALGKGNLSQFIIKRCRLFRCYSVRDVEALVRMALI